MGMELKDIAWHQSVGQLIDALDAPNFWIRLVRLLARYLPFDSWVALLFSAGRPVVLAESPTSDGGPDPLFQDYINGLYLLDPFYIASRERAHNGLVRLDDVAPECFEQTDYYRLYFRLNVVADEIQINCQIDADQTLCLSLGSRQRFKPDQIALLGLIQPWIMGLMRQRLRFEQGATTPSVPAWQHRLETTSQRSEMPLTTREMDVARLVLSGCSGKEIARKLDISVETVKVHRKHIYTKLNIKSQSELFAVFFQIN
ncbi:MULTISPECIES: helix-turn-helix transcriptional regulator [Pseudomonas]|uniref:helix-turn-helix transcriptional regulator n=1 Tax=Pseudomonas TaxID=286 RepID=UPI0025B1CF21|nr:MULTISPECIES: LuxR C-terminal-related transcriptional regulator [Pseudomonas]MDN3235754.1 LuxR C-terminal-related transcriptional regulator [Pseudomonas sp. WAC2]